MCLKYNYYKLFWSRLNCVRFLTFAGGDAVVIGDVGGVELGEGEEDDGARVPRTRQRRLASRTAARAIFGRRGHVVEDCFVAGRIR